MKLRPSTRDAIVEAAFQIYGENPSASLADIAARAGVGRATLHRHFTSREELLVALAKIALDELDAVADEAAEGADTYTQALKLVMEAMVPLAGRQWFLAREPVEEHPEIQQRYRRQADEMTEAIKAAQQEGGIDASAPTAWVVKAYDYLLFAAWEMVRDGDATPKQAADLAWRTLVNGIGSNGGE